MRDYYQILGLPHSATGEDLKGRYRFLSQAYHPDKFSSPEHKAQGEAEFKAINEAYSVLIDPNKRRRYDASRRNSTSSESRRPGPPPPRPPPRPATTKKDGDTTTTQSKRFSYFDWIVKKMLASFGLVIVVTPLIIWEKCTDTRARRSESNQPQPGRFIAPVEDRIAASQTGQNLPINGHTAERKSSWRPPSTDLLVSVSFPKRFFPARSFLDTPIILHENFTWSCNEVDYRRMAEQGAFTESDFSVAILTTNHVFIDKYRRWQNPPKTDAGEEGPFTLDFPGSTDLGRLKIENGTGKTAIVKLIDTVTESKACSLVVLASSREA
jgi:hypothetical protein